MGLLDHAKLELEISGLFSEKGDFYNGMTGKAVMELIEVFSNQGHSGMSAALVVDLFRKLALYEPLMPITGCDEEFNILNYGDNIHAQNKRDSRIFKDKNGKYTFSDAIIKKCPNGTCWHGLLYLTREDAILGVNGISCSQEIKQFPFVPKTFYIDVLEEEVAKDDWVMWCKDPSQLDEVWEYYKKPEDIY